MNNGDRSEQRFYGYVHYFYCSIYVDLIIIVLVTALLLHQFQTVWILNLDFQNYLQFAKKYEVLGLDLDVITY